MESQNFLNIIGNGSDLGKYLEIFAQLPDGKSTNPGKFNFLYISLLNFLNLVLIPGAKFGKALGGTWKGCAEGSLKALNIFRQFLIRAFESRWQAVEMRKTQAHQKWFEEVAGYFIFQFTANL